MISHYLNRIHSKSEVMFSSFTRLYAITMFLLFLGQVNAQPLTSEEQSKIKDNILLNCPCLYKIEVTYKPKNDSEEKQKIDYYLSDMGAAMETQEMASGTFNNGGYYVDKETKEIYLYNTNQNIVDLSKQQGLKQLMDTEMKGLIKKKEGELYYVQTVNHTGEIFKIKIYFDKDYRIAKTIMDMADINIANGENKPNGDRVIVNYVSKITGKAANPPTIAKFAYRKGNTWVTNKSYSSYKLIIQ